VQEAVLGTSRRGEVEGRWRKLRIVGGTSHSQGIQCQVN
jgi:hypothetical protein